MSRLFNSISEQLDDMFEIVIRTGEDSIFTYNRSDRAYQFETLKSCGYLTRDRGYSGPYGVKYDLTEGVQFQLLHYLGKALDGDVS